MLTVPDTQVVTVASELAQHVPVAEAANPPVAFDCSGVLDAATLAPLHERGWLLASAHALLNFASPETGVAQFVGTPCGLEGDAAAVQMLTDALMAIGGKSFDVASELRPLHHTTAVFSSNFNVVLQGVMQEVWRAAGVSEVLLPRLNAALLQTAVDNLLAIWVSENADRADCTRRHRRLADSGRCCGQLASAGRRCLSHAQCARGASGTVGNSRLTPVGTESAD